MYCQRNMRGYLFTLSPWHTHTLSLSLSVFSSDNSEGKLRGMGWGMSVQNIYCYHHVHMHTHTHAHTPHMYTHTHTHTQATRSSESAQSLCHVQWEDGLLSGISIAWHICVYTCERVCSNVMTIGKIPRDTYQSETDWERESCCICYTILWHCTCAF